MRGTAVFRAFYARVPHYLGDIWPSPPSFVSFVVHFVSVNEREINTVENEISMGQSLATLRLRSTMGLTSGASNRALNLPRIHIPNSVEFEDF